MAKCSNILWLQLCVHMSEPILSRGQIMSTQVICDSYDRDVKDNVEIRLRLDDDDGVELTNWIHIETLSSCGPCGNVNSNSEMVCRAVASMYYGTLNIVTGPFISGKCPECSSDMQLEDVDHEMMEIITRAVANMMHDYRSKASAKRTASTTTQ